MLFLRSQCVCCCERSVTLWWCCTKISYYSRTEFLRSSRVRVLELSAATERKCFIYYSSTYRYNPANGANCEDALLESVHHEE